MIGCIAQAGSVDVVADEHEMEEVRWVTKAGTQFRGVASLLHCCCIIQMDAASQTSCGPALMKL
jgi:hypothetical protein